MKVKPFKKYNLSIKFYIFSTMIALTILMIGILWAFQGIFLNTVFKLTKERDLERASGIIVDNFNSNDVSSLMSQVSIEYNLCAMVINMNNGEITQDEHFHVDCILHKISGYDSLLTSWYDEAKNNEGKYSVIIPRDRFRDFNYNEANYEGNVPDHEESKNCIISVSIIKSSDGMEYMLVLNSSVEPMKATVRAIRIILAFVSLIFLIVSILISYLLSRKLSKPIEKITNSAKDLKSGDYKVRFEEAGLYEVTELAKTLNTTAVELDNADKLQKELIANISHDLRTPLTMISGYSEFMRDFPSEITPENMQVIIDETARLNSLVNDLLDVSKMQSGTQTVDMKKISITKVISDTVKRYETLTSHNDYKITFVHEEDGVNVMADETRLLQVIYNLVNNAINYTGDDKTVTIRQDVLDDVVRISVIDTGDGISEENLPLVWDRYYKIDKVHKRAILGTGLGLSIVKNILMLHQSRFGVSSEVGKGSTFWFEFKTVK